ncbi:CGLD27 family protein [Oxynema sp. CENA135]|uniref:CGLD27 family protein n=1 Tax=Oxynema sp. CENA135 TaxID=984206 RepID=UPI00190BAD27|nr:CGLD27 family protein [Oxynema sp. CENA135]MBK4729403.1 CGLD27 family protein [Oxynema sp. CENA135]
MRETSIAQCPVPDEQQPLNEYEQLKESCFFGWATRDRRGYATQIALIWGCSCALCFPIAAASFAPSKHLGECMLCTAGGGNLFLSLALLRLYLGWRYVRDRLWSPTIFYEESGWYDGQAWTKTPELLARDRLVVNYQLRPILTRLSRSLGAIALSCIVGATLWAFL